MDTVNVNDQKGYQKYLNQFKKINIKEIVTAVLSISIVILIIFLPIFKFDGNVKVPIRTLEDFDNDYLLYTVYSLTLTEEDLERGYTIESQTGKFSLFDEWKMSLSDIKDIMDTSDFGVSSIFSFAEIIYTIILIALSGKKLFNGIGNCRSFENYAITLYTEIKKNGSKKERSNTFKNQSVAAFVSFVIIHCVYAKFIGKLLADISGNGAIGYMANISGITGWCYLAIAASIIAITMSFITKKDIKNVNLLIAKEDL